MRDPLFYLKVLWRDGSITTQAHGTLPENLAGLRSTNCRKVWIEDRAGVEVGAALWVS